NIYVRSAVASSALTTGSNTNGVVTGGGSGSSVGASSSSSSTTASAPPAVTAVNGGAVPLSTFTHFESRSAPLSVNHQGQFPVVPISFNLAPGASLGEAPEAINRV